jgi:hypothetical protein
MSTSNTITFDQAEIKKLTVKKLVSLDKEYELVLRTADQGVMLADAFNSETLFKVTLEATA